MWRKLLNGILEDGIVDVCDDEIVAIVRLLETHGFEQGQSAINFRNSRLHCIVIQIDFPELLILGVFLDVFNESCHGF